MAFPESSMSGTPEEFTVVLMHDGRALGFSTAFGNVCRSGTSEGKAGIPDTATAASTSGTSGGKDNVTINGTTTASASGTPGRETDIVKQSTCG